MVEPWWHQSCLVKSEMRSSEAVWLAHRPADCESIHEQLEEYDSGFDHEQSGSQAQCVSYENGKQDLHRDR